MKTTTEIKAGSKLTLTTGRVLVAKSAPAKVAGRWAVLVEPTVENNGMWIVGVNRIASVEAA